MLVANKIVTLQTKVMKHMKINSLKINVHIFLNVITG